MIHTFQRANIVAVENNLAFQLVPILLDVVMLHHNDDHINFAKELVKIKDLVFHNLLVGKEWIKCA